MTVGSNRGERATVQTSIANFSLEGPPTSPSKPFRPASLHPHDPAADETDSGVFLLNDSSVLLVLTPGPDVAPLVRAMEEEGFTAVPVNDAALAESTGYVPRLAVLDSASPGAIDFLRRINAHGTTLQAIVTLPPGERESVALAAGAQLTLQRPLSAADVVTCLQRFRTHQELMTRSRDVFDSERPSVPPPLIESVLATIGHEIRNPLAAALANVECLRDGIETPLSEEDRRATIDDTALALRRIQDVMTAVSSLVKGTPPVLEKVDLWSVAERAVSSVRPHDTRIEIAGDRVVRGWGNAALLEQVVANLVQNALDATLGQDKRHVLVRVYCASGEARISVRDNGPGVPAALRQRIFEPFFTTKGERGTGLGLVLVRHAVSRMGGTLTLGPSERGAVFRVRLRAV
ncbi:MAG: integral rane sensor signal transduction histidine kinase [Polyangiaceae bacterium]|nr:integral rane sensor signal transduction histidine kinase [Polyangiaceae bacterium]